MARQTLILFILIIGAMLLFRGGCSQKPALPPAEPLERIYQPAAEDRAVLRDEVRDLTIAFDGAGSVVSVQRGPESIVRPLSRSRGPFSLVLATKANKKRALNPSRWTHQEIPGGLEFTYEEGDLHIVKRVLLADEGEGIDVQLTVKDTPEDVRGLEMTGASGVEVVPTAPGGEEGIAFWKIAGEEIWTRTLEEIREEQEGQVRTHAQRVKNEQETSASLDVSRRRKLDGDAVVERFGILGSRSYLALEGLPAVDALNLVAFRVDRGGEQTREIETWTSLLAINRGYSGTFRLRWAARESAEERTPGLAALVQRVAETRLTLENDTMRVELTDRGAAITGLWLKDYSEEAGQEAKPANWVRMLGEGVRRSELPLILSVDDPDLLGGNPATLLWQAKYVESAAVTYSLVTERGWHIEKAITLPREGSYDLGVEVRVTRPSGASVERAKYRLIGPSGSYITDAYRGIIGAEPPAGILLERRGGDSAEENLEKLAKEGEPLLHRYGDEARHLLRGVGVRGAFFLAALVTEERLDGQGRPLGTVAEAGVRALDLEEPEKRPDGELLRQTLMGYAVNDVPFDGGVATSRFRLYAGPNDLGLLRPLQIEDAIHFGTFGVIGRFLMWLMKLLEGLVGSYGIAIILMTFIVRGLLLPVSYKTQVSMQRYGKRMQKLKPILEEIQKKHAKNPQKLNAERMRVMKEHKVGFPLGCLTMFIQIPIWFALFGALRVEFSLRHQPFLWASDLSMPDRLFALPFWPHWFNLLPLLMLVLWVLQQKATPTPNSEDPQVKAQMKIVRFMPYIFFFMLYKYAAALAVYMCVSSAWGIVEGRMVRKAIAAQA